MYLISPLCLFFWRFFLLLLVSPKGIKHSLENKKHLPSFVNCRYVFVFSFISSVWLHNSESVSLSDVILLMSILSTQQQSGIIFFVFQTKLKNTNLYIILSDLTFEFWASSLLSIFLNLYLVVSCLAWEWSFPIQKNFAVPGNRKPNS